MFSTEKYMPTTHSAAVSASFARICGILVIAASLVLTSFAGLTGNSAGAQTIPVDRAKLAKELSEKHAEESIAMGIANNGGVMELFANENGDTWTLILTMPDGRSFLIGTGESWAGAPFVSKGKKI